MGFGNFKYKNFQGINCYLKKIKKLNVLNSKK